MIELVLYALPTVISACQKSKGNETKMVNGQQGMYIFICMCGSVCNTYIYVYTQNVYVVVYK